MTPSSDVQSLSPTSKLVFMPRRQGHRLPASSLVLTWRRPDFVMSSGCQRMRESIKILLRQVMRWHLFPFPTSYDRFFVRTALSANNVHSNMSLCPVLLSRLQRILFQLFRDDGPWTFDGDDEKKEGPVDPGPPVCLRSKLPPANGQIRRGIHIHTSVHIISGAK